MELNNCYINCLESNDPRTIEKVQLILFTYGFKWNDNKQIVRKSHGPFIYMYNNYLAFNEVHTKLSPFCNFKLIPLTKILKL